MKYPPTRIKIKRMCEISKKAEETFYVTHVEISFHKKVLNQYVEVVSYGVK